MAFKYKGFISYSHANAKWGERLHRALEGYSIPSSYVGMRNNRGEPIAARLGRFFRDRDELNASSSLTESIRVALCDSENLIVICSPQSAASRYVEEEIIEFKRLGRAERIFALIVSGQPHAADKPGSVHEECFSKALKLRFDEKSQALSDEPATAEIMAADARKEADGDQRALVKLIAGLLDVDFDLLYQRERRRAQQRRFAYTASGVAIFTAVAASGWIALEKAREAEDKGRIAMLEAHANALDVANESRSTGAQDDAVKVLQQLRPKAGEEDLRGFAWHLLWEPYQSYRDVVFVDGSLSHVSVAQDGTTMAVANSSRIVTFWNLETGEKLGEMRDKDDKITAVHYPPRAQIGLAALERGRRMQEGFRVFDSPANHLPGSLVEQRLWSASPSGEYVLATEYATAPHAVSRLTSKGEIEPLRNVSAMGRAHSWSSDSTLLATTDGERVQVESLRDGTNIATFNPANKLQILDLEFTPRNEIVVVGRRADDQQVLLVLNVSTGKERLVFDAPDATHSSAVALRFSPDGKRLAALFGKSTSVSPVQRSVVTCWDLETGKLLFTLDEKATRFATSIAFSPDSQVLATGSRDLGIRLWHADSGSMQRLLGFHHGMRLREGEEKRRHSDDAIVSVSGLMHGGVPFIAFARNGTLLITGSGLNNTVRTWELLAGRERIALPEPLKWDQRAWLAASKAPSELAVLWRGADMSAGARLWQAGQDRSDAAIDLPDDRIQSWALAPDGSRVAGVDADEALAIWPSDDPANVARHRATPVATSSENSAPLASSQGIVFSPDSRLIASSSGRRTLVRNTSGETNAILTGTAPLAFSADGSRLANMDACSAVQIWDVAAKRLLARLPLPDRCASALAVAPDGSVAVAVISGGIGAIVGGKPTAMVWEIESGRSWTLPDYDDEHLSVAVFSPDGRTLATVGKGGVIHLWHPRVARRPLALDGPGKRVYHLAFSRDGRTLLALDQDGVRLIQTREEDRRMRASGWGASDEVNSVVDKLKEIGKGR